MLSKSEDKEKRIDEIREKISLIQADIAALQSQKQESIKSGLSEQAIELLKKQRDKEDELKILNQVLANIQLTPAVSKSEILETWDDICKGLLTECEKEVLPELEDAYNRYCKAADKIVELRRKAQQPAALLERIAELQGIRTVLRNPFKGVETDKFHINKPIIAKLNCLYNPIMDTPISSPI